MSLDYSNSLKPSQSLGNEASNNSTNYTNFSDNREVLVSQKKLIQLASNDLSNQPVVQLHDGHNSARLNTARENSRNFADATTNAERDDLQDEDATTHRNQAREMRLDHGVSQANLGSLNDGIEIVRLLTEPGGTKYQILKTAHQNLIGEINASPEWDNHDTINGFLINIRANLTPGFSRTIGNPGDMFDIQVVEANGTVSQSPYVPDLKAIDDNLRTVNRLSGKLPNQHNGMQVAHHNPKLENDLAAAFNAIATALNNLNGVNEPTFDSDLWYRYNDNWVKKVAAEYIEDMPNDGTETIWDIPAAETEYDWTITLPNYSVDEDDREADTAYGDLGDDITYEDDIDIDVNVSISADTWEHIYERHTIGKFAGDIQATNTFWKNNPSGVITEALLKAEINLIIDRLMNLHMIENGDSEHINATANSLFFQGNIDYMELEDEKSLVVTLDSIAPQSSALAVAMEPENLSGIIGEIEEQQEVNQMMNMGDLFA